MDPDLIALLDRLGELTADELTDLDTRLRAAFTALDESGPTDELPDAAHADVLDEISLAVERVSTENTARVEAAAAAQAAAAQAAAQAEERRTAARERLAVTEPEVPEEANPDGKQPEGTPAEPVVQPAKQPEAVAAAATRRTLGAMTRTAPRTAAPAPATPRVTTALVAAADVRGFGIGQELTDWSQVGRAISNRLQGLGGSGTPDPVLVASLRTSYPAERVLSAGDAAGNNAKIEAAFSPADGLVAAGGICGPLPVDYSIAEVGDLGRPFRDSKARFNADRGGITTNVPPTLTQADAGVGFWTLENDANPGGVGVAEPLATKPVVEFDCGGEVTSYVYAATLRARFSNARARFSPESVASNTRMGMVSHARLAELRLMNLQIAASTAVTSAALLGASKDLFGTLDSVAAHMRYRQRRSSATPLRATLPGWVKDMVRADFVRQMPAGDPTAQYAVADETMARMFAARNVNVTWTIEDVDGGAAGGIGAAQTAGPILDFPDTVRWLLEYEGDVLFLDGGELDLGVVRDSALNAVNKYETFYETWEGIHVRGAEKPLAITSTLNPNGAAAGLVATATGSATADL